eukprot:CAMPEP_0184725838 /NCGR_PEP_ID=MMETSP0314-20130426/31988_1 /TAXON_ID=38298 /ORGANISM="Rhodella maculata, Strain CCMP 736" /LENGTH=81 /DNA_ID=CAMNT_0027191147 /DNA_START=14 /DNA_END=255 /DNA_ORIENTATION=-
MPHPWSYGMEGYVFEDAEAAAASMVDVLLRSTTLNEEHGAVREAEGEHTVAEIIPYPPLECTRRLLPGGPALPAPAPRVAA